MFFFWFNFTSFCLYFIVFLAGYQCENPVNKGGMQFFVYFWEGEGVMLFLAGMCVIGL